MSQPDSELAEAPSVLNKQPALTVYTSLLLVAVLFMLAAFVFLVLEWKGYGFNWKPSITAQSAHHSDYVSTLG